MNFRLPYWDWDTPSHRKLPGAYTDPNDNSNPLWNGTRSMDPTDEIPDEDVGEAVDGRNVPMAGLDWSVQSVRLEQSGRK